MVLVVDDRVAREEKVLCDAIEVSRMLGSLLAMIMMAAAARIEEVESTRQGLWGTH